MSSKASNRSASSSTQRGGAFRSFRFRGGATVCVVSVLACVAALVLWRNTEDLGLRKEDSATPSVAVAEPSPVAIQRQLSAASQEAMDRAAALLGRVPPLQAKPSESGRPQIPAVQRGERSEEWLKLPRTRFVPADLVREHGEYGSLAARNLLRNLTLNPDDIEIHGDLWGMLQALIQSYEVVLRECRQGMLGLTLQEVKELRAAGRERRLSIAEAVAAGHIDGVKLKQAEESVARKMAGGHGESVATAGESNLLVPEIFWPNRKPPHIMNRHGDHIWFAEVDDLPGTKALLDCEEILMAQLLSEICYWFVGVGVCDLSVVAEQQELFRLATKK